MTIKPIVIIMSMLILSMTATRFDFIGTLECMDGVEWCADIHYEEIDPVANDDYGDVPRFCTKMVKYVTNHTHTDSVDASGNYEPLLTINHNCTKQGFVKWTHQLPDVATSELHVAIAYQVKLVEEKITVKIGP